MSLKTQQPTDDVVEDELFGGRLKSEQGWTRHAFAYLDTGFGVRARQLPHALLLALRLAWQADRRAFLQLMICHLISGVAGAFTLLATNSALTTLLVDGPIKERVREAVPALALVAVIGGVGALARAGAHAATGRLEPRAERAARLRLLSGAVRVEQLAVEDAAFQNLLNAASVGCDSVRRILRYSAEMIGALIGIAGAAGVLTILHPLLLPLLVLIILPRGWEAVRSAHRRHASVRVWLEHHRRQTVIADLLTDKETAEEIRVHGGGAYLLEQFSRMSAAAEEEQARLARTEALGGLLAGGLAGLATTGTYALLGLLLANGNVPLATAGAAVLAIRTGTANLSAVVFDANELYEEALFVADLDEACEQAEARAIPGGERRGTEQHEVIRAEGVSFTYPGATRPALDGVDVEIRRGEIVALVGANGSGKTTLAKLLSGLYVADGGTVTWDGHPVDRLDRDDVFAGVALISQDFPHWPFTADTNIALGRPTVPRDPGRLREAARNGDAEQMIDELPRGMRTLLARGFEGGVELSGGQWQRLALARGWYRDAGLLICDEPTAALDPRAEIEAFDRIRGLTGSGRSVLLITHRMASVRHADRIYLLDGGRVVESGSHRELMKAGTRYAALYRMQAEQFEVG